METNLNDSKGDQMSQIFRYIKAESNADALPFNFKSKESFLVIFYAFDPIILQYKTKILIQLKTWITFE
jgi:hypothetical protein